jgi:hypothetical protein
MTICIAAICENGKAIVTASDREFGVGFTSAEFEDAKIMPLFHEHNPGNWVVGLSGDVSHATEVLGALRLLQDRLEGYDWHDIQDLLEKSYRRIRMEKVEGEVLAPRGWTLDRFQGEGAKLLPPATYASIDTRISIYDLGASLIVGGFGTDGLPFILTVRNPGIVTDHTKLGFWCIGSGSTLAQSSLFSRNYSWSFSVEKAAYLVYEAKKNSERATGVGTKETDIAIITRTQMGRVMPVGVNHLHVIFNEIKPKEYDDNHDSQLCQNAAFQHVRTSL